MSAQFLTSMTEEEFREMLKDVVREVLSEKQGNGKEQPSEILDVEQASQFLKLKVTTLYEKTSRKLIPHFKKGNKLYFYLSELRQWIKKGKVKTNDEIECEAATFTLNKKM